MADALLAVRLLAIAPQKLGGICLRGGGPARDLVLGYLKVALPETSPSRRLPANIDDEGLLGGVDIAASLAEGRAVERAGLLSEVRGGVVMVPMAERLREATAGRLAQTLDDKDIALVALDDGRKIR